jgi:hypothetical protein
MTNLTNRRVGLLAGAGMILIPGALAVLWATTPGGLQSTLLVNAVFGLALAAVMVGGVMVLVRSWKLDE